MKPFAATLTSEEIRFARKVEAARLASYSPVSYTHLRAHETVLDLVCRLLLEKKKNTCITTTTYTINTQI